MTLPVRVEPYCMSATIEVQKRTPEAVSLSNEHFCRYLGLIALCSEKQASNEHLERQIITELAESIDAEMGTHGAPITLKIIDNELTDSDERSMTLSAYAWREVQAARAVNDPKLAWFARFAEIESIEHADVVQFTQYADDGDSMVVISPFPEEAYENQRTRATVANEGFRPDIRRAFIRVYEKIGDEVREHIQSIDSSSLTVWNTTLSQVFNAKSAMTTEQLLEKRFIQKNVAPQKIIEQLTHVYDGHMSTQTGCVHRYGRSPGGSIEANTFVRENPDIVANVLRQMSEITITGHAADELANNILYNSKALLHKRLKGEPIGDDIKTETEAAGAAAAAEGTVFYGCSGASSALVSQAAQLAHEVSFSLMNGLEGVTVSQCPMCGKECFTAIRDKKTGKYYCTNKNCTGYSAEKIQAAYGAKAKTAKSFTESFADALIDLFSTKKSIRKK
jgi:hypothetical protein